MKIIKNVLRFFGLLMVSLLILPNCASKNTSRGGTRQLLNNSGKANKPKGTDKKSVAEDPIDKEIKDYIHRVLYEPTELEKAAIKLAETRKREVDILARREKASELKIYCDGYLEGVRKALSDARVLEDVTVSGEKKK